MKDYVLSRAFDPLRCVVDEYDVDKDALTEGLSFTHEEIRNSWYQKVRWEEFVEYCQRLEDQTGPRAIDEIGKFLPQIIAFSPFLRVGGLVAGPRWYYNLSKHWFGPTMFPCVDLDEYVETGPRTLRVVLRIPDHLPDCPQFFRISAAFDRQGPVLLGLEPASVQLQQEERRGVYTIHYPPSASIGARIRRAAKAAFSSDHLLREYAMQHERLVRSFDAAQRSELSFRQLVERSPDGVVIYDEERIHYVNDAMVELLGIDDGQKLVEMPLEAICPDPSPLKLDANDSASGAHTRQATFVGANNEAIKGEVKTFSAYVEGDPVLVSIVRDVTLRNEVLARAMDMDRIISTGMMAAGVAHEINNPLSYVHANLDFLLESLNDGQPDDEEFEDILASLKASLGGVERIQAIVEDLNTFHRTPESSLAAVDLNAAIEPSLRWIEPKLRNRATLELSLQSSPLVWSNANRIGQVVLNLLVNAADAIEPGDVMQNTVSVRTYCDDERAIVEVKDTGSGIPEDRLTKIFDPFFSTKPAGQGTGLGLFLTRKILDRLEGDISIQSEVGQGTCVRVALPRYRQV